jgi:intracellular sulfur oxidation DsrE/DsrF family protein
MTRRRDFLARLGLAAAVLGIDMDELRGQSAVRPGSPWDTSWLERLAGARYRVVFNANVIDDGGVFSYVSTFLDHFHDVHNTTDAETVPVVVFRRLGTSMAANDHLWDRYEVGADSKIDDPDTKSPARRNVFWRAGRSGGNSATIETLHKRGMVSLVCNVSLGNMGRRWAERTQQDIDQVQAEVRANLVPGAIVVPSGIYALIRAQNAGCAFMLGT